MQLIFVSSTQVKTQCHVRMMNRVQQAVFNQEIHASLYMKEVERFVFGDC
jgi:hypothetical protein